VHFAAAQWHTPDGVWVAPNRLQPGDLVFFIGSDGTRKSPGHVGIYIGDGFIVDAPHTGSFVRIDSLNERKLANQYVGARRIDTQLVDVRHLLHVTKPAAFATVFPLGFTRSLTLASVGQPLGIVAAGTPAIGTASRNYWVWAGVVVGLFLPLSAGGFFIRRRQRPKASPSSEASS
jgi:hypothetical protein